MKLLGIEQNGNVSAFDHDELTLFAQSVQWNAVLKFNAMCG